MNSKNSEDVRKGMLRFCYYLAGSIFFAICILYCFMQTASVEVSRILSKTREYDVIQMQQVRITESVDSIYFYAKLLNADTKINSLRLHNYLSDNKIRITNTLSSMDTKDFQLYHKLSSQMNTFFEIKDSIRIANRDGEILKMDLARCISDNKQITRRMSIGGLTYGGRR